MKNTTAAALGVAAGLVVGIGSGAAVAGEPEARTPVVCQQALTRATDLFELSGDLLEQVRLRGDALGKDDYLKYDTAAKRVLGELEPAESAYVSAAAQCRDAS